MKIYTSWFKVTQLYPPTLEVVSFVVKNSGLNSLREEIKLAVEGQATSITELRQREAQKSCLLPVLEFQGLLGIFQN